ncbi:MAG: trypsin-like peptidase domain-containing protein [Ignavibacteriae bacterium]|nr:trypsin-like peptidase domain-containing protein [Ignavibacteriota bacterium]
MNRAKIFLCLCFAAMLCGCASTSSDYMLAPSVNLNAFQYVYVEPLKYQSGREDIWGIATKLAGLFSSKGIQVFTTYDEVKRTLGGDEFGQLLVCRIWHEYSWRKATCTIDLYDYKQQRVFHGVGKYETDYLSSLPDEGEYLISAATQAFASFAKLYTKFDPSLAKRPVEELKRETAKWEKLDYDEEQLREYYDSNNADLDPIEGIWTSIEDNMYRLGIIKDSKSKTRDFVAVIIQAEHLVWEPKQVKIEFQKTIYGKAYTTTYYMSDFSRQGTTSYITDAGVLEIPLKDPNSKEFKASWIKNYPIKESKSTGPFSSSETDKSASSGTGFLLTESGIVITNWHVVKGNEDIQVSFPSSGKNYKATVSLKDAGNDLAVLKLSEFRYSKDFKTAIPYKVVSTKQLKTGQDVFTLGFPLGEILGSTAKLSSGTVSSLFGIKDDPRLIQISNPVQPGNSGGPLFNRNGDLVGIVVASLNARYFFESADILPQNVNFAIKSDYLINLTSMLPEDDELQKHENRLSVQPLDRQVELITPFIVTIKAK